MTISPKTFWPLCRKLLPRNQDTLTAHDRSGLRKITSSGLSLCKQNIEGALFATSVVKKARQKLGPIQPA